MATSKNRVIDMHTHFDVDATMEELTQKRFAMPAPVVAAFRQAAMKSALRLLDLVEDDEKFERMRVQDKLRVMELIFDRAYGKAETASNHAITEIKTGAVKSTDHSKQLDAIADRMARREARSNGDGGADGVGGAAGEGAGADGDGGSDAAVGSMDVFPELRQRAARAEAAKNAQNVVSLPRRPL